MTKNMLFTLNFLYFMSWNIFITGQNALVNIDKYDQNFLFHLCIFFLFLYFTTYLTDHFSFISDSNTYYHHHVMPPAQISLTLYRHFSLSFIASGRSSGLHPVSSHSWCMYVRAGRPAFAQLYIYTQLSRRTL